MKQAKTLHKSKYFPLIIKFFFACAFLFSLYIAFYQLGKSPLENWDEAWYADATRHMLQTKEFFVLYWNNAVWFDKPPLYMWLSALVSSVIGLSELSVRVPSAIAGVAVLMLVLWFAYKNYGFVPAFLAFATLALNNLFVWRMRSGNIDILPTLLILLAFLVQVSKHKYKYIILGLLFGLLYLTRAQLVFFPILIFVLHELFYERKNILKNIPEYLKMFGAMIALPAIWLIGGSLKDGIEFANYFLFHADHGVATVSLQYANPDYFLYTYYSLQRRFVVILIIGVLFAIRYIKDPKAFLLLLYGGALLAQLSFTERSNNWYLVPATPFWSLLIAYGTYHALKLVKQKQINLLVAIVLVAITAVLSYRTYTINIIPIIDTYANVNQTESAKKINQITSPGETVVRLDHLYPSAVYYTDRTILSSPDGTLSTEQFWITRAEILARVQQKKLKWIYGKTSDVTAFKATAPANTFKEIKVNDEETILQVN